MYELIQISPNCYYIESPTKIGLVKINSNDVCLIDSGNDKSAGKKILRIIEKNNWNLVAIYNTHSNADHVGGNKYMQDRTGCKIYAPPIESDFTNHPILEPAFLYGGFPPKDLCNKFLLPQESIVEPLTKEALPAGFEIIPLPGHFFNMVGYKTPEGVLYLADCLSSIETLDKYQISFIYDIEAYLQTLEYIKTIEGKFFIPSHTAPTTNISELAQYNIDKVNEIADKILFLCTSPITFENLLHNLFNEYNLTMNFNQFVLVGSTVRSYLSWLKYKGKVTTEFKDNYLFWVAFKYFIKTTGQTL